MKIKLLNTSQANFNKRLNDHLSFKQENFESVEKTVDKILKKIEETGDNGLRLLIKIAETFMRSNLYIPFFTNFLDNFFVATNT